jgi:hypothetical protein
MVDSVPLHYFTAVASPFAHATTASNANPDRHNGFTAGSNERCGGKSNAEDYAFLPEMRRERDFFADRLIAFVRFLCHARN